MGPDDDSDKVAKALLMPCASCSLDGVKCDDKQEVMTAVEAAEFLRISRDSLYDAAGRGDIPHRRIGRRLVFSRASLLAWLSCKPARTG